MNLTNAEKILWNALRNGKLNGLKFKRQHSIGNYVVDFYCYKLRLIIELDGGVHLIEYQKEKDHYRDQNLQAMNYTIQRYKNEEIENYLDKVLEKIANTPARENKY